MFFFCINTYLQVLVFPLRTLNKAVEVVLKQYETQQYSDVCILHAGFSDTTKSCRKLLLS